MPENYRLGNDDPEGLTASAIAATAANLGIITTKDDWNFRPGDDTSAGRPYVEHQLTRGRLCSGSWSVLRREPTALVWCRIWCLKSSAGTHRFQWSGSLWTASRC